jgi:hypothetical protein
VRAGIHWDANGSHGDCLSGDTRDRVVMFVGTGRRADKRVPRLDPGGEEEACAWAD